MPVIMFRSVLLPLPDFPMMLTNSPGVDLQVNAFQRVKVAGRARVVLVHGAQVDHQ